MRRLILILVCLILASITKAQSVGNGACSTATGTSLGVTYPNNTTSGSTFVVWLSWNWNQTNTLTGVADNNSNNYYNVGSPVAEVNNNYGYEVWQSFNTANSPNAKATITVTLGSSQTLHVCIAELTGMANPYPLDKFSELYSGNGAMGSAGTLNGATTPTTRDANELIVGFGFTRAGNISAGTGYTCNIADGTGTNGCTSPHYMIESKTVSSTGTQQATFSSSTSSDDGVFFTLTFRETGSTISGLYWVQGNALNDLVNSLTASVSLAVSPSVETGNHLVVVSYWSYFSSASCPTTSSVLDGNSNSYAAGGASTCDSGVSLRQFYRLLTPGNATKTVTITFNSGSGNYTDCLATIDDFYYPAGTVTQDGTTGSSPTILCGTTGPPYSCTGPTINVATSGDLVYASWIVPDNGANVSPWPGATSGSWIGTNGAMPYTGTSTGLNNGQWTASGEYIASSASGNQTPTWQGSYSGDDYVVGITAFKFVPSATPGKAIIF